MTVREYCALAGLGEHVVREDIRTGKIPHRLCGRRGLIRILRGPALAQLGIAPRPGTTERTSDAVVAR